jgi:hypothetical protein
MFKKYKKRLEKLLKREKFGRKQLNFACDVGLTTRLKLLATYLETPFYPLAEHVLELGMSEVAVILSDSALTENLQRHLLEEHLLVGQLDPVDSYVSERARRIDNALDFLKLIEHKAGSVEAVERLIGRILKEA